MDDELVLTVTSASGCMAVTTSAASTCPVRMLSRAQKASATAMRRPGGHEPSIQPISVTMLGSLIVTQRRQYGARGREDPRHVPGEDVRRAGPQPELLAEPRRVGEVVQGDDGLQAPVDAHGEDFGVTLEGGVVVDAGPWFEAGPLDRQAEGVAADGGGPVERVGGTAPEVTRQARAGGLAGALPGGPVVVRLAVAVVPALDLVARGRHADEEALAEEAGR